MAFKARNVVPATGYSHARTDAVTIADICTTTSTLWQSGANANQLLGFMWQLQSRRNDLASYASITGIGQYAKDQENDPAYDVGAEFAALLSAIDDVLDAIVTGMPKDGGGYVLEKTLDPATRLPIYRTFTGGQLVGIRTLLDAVNAAVV